MKINTTFIIITALLVAVGAYWYFFTGTGNQPPLSTDASVTTGQVPTQFELLVGELDSISFNTGIFSDARFDALDTIATPISPESFGRTDPLAPVSSVSIVVSPAPSIVSGTSTPALGEN